MIDEYDIYELRCQDIERRRSARDEPENGRTNLTAGEHDQ